MKLTVTVTVESDDAAIAALGPRIQAVLDAFDREGGVTAVFKNAAIQVAQEHLAKGIVPRDCWTPEGAKRRLDDLPAMGELLDALKEPKERS